MTSTKVLAGLVVMSLGGGFAALVRSLLTSLAVQYDLSDGSDWLFVCWPSTLSVFPQRSRTWRSVDWLTIYDGGRLVPHMCHCCLHDQITNSLFCIDMTAIHSCKEPGLEAP